MPKKNEKVERKFNPEGKGYDYETARKHNIKPDETGHWQSRVPETGQLLKGRGHKTFYKTVQAEEGLMNTITRGKDGKYYSK